MDVARQYSVPAPCPSPADRPPGGAFNPWPPGERTLSDDGKHVDTPKGGFGRRVDLSNEAVRILRAHLVRRREEKLRHRWPALPEALFCSPAGTRADPSDVRTAFRRVSVAAGLTVERPGPDGKPRIAPRFSPQGFAHTFAALHLQAGIDVYYVSRMLGHADITLTVHKYGAWLQPDRRPAVDVLDRTPAAEAAEVTA